jgi:hypothetical protein
MQFQVPQFLDVEDRVVGPLTIKQFLYVTGSIGMAYMFVRFIPWFFIALIPAVSIAGFGVALAFWRPNRRPFIDIVEAAFYFATSTRLYVWRQQHKDAVVEEIDLSRFNATHHVRGPAHTNMGGSRLSNLSWQMDLETGSQTPNPR